MSAFPYDTDWTIEREIALESKRKRIKSRLCTFPDCERKAARGWTTCWRHYTAGGRATTWLKLHTKNEAGNA